VLLAIESGNRRLGFAVTAHFDKAKSFAPARIAIVDDLSRNHRTMSFEQLLQRRAVNIVAEVPHIQLLTHVCLLHNWTAQIYQSGKILKRGS
jgi:hypothetical protein